MEYGKLIELLNEYQQDFRYQDESDVDYREARIISKSYGFIKRLVKNDKIDTECQKVLHTVGAKAQGIGLECLWYSDYESLLMILSIQDNPIEYLCSILR